MIEMNRAPKMAPPTAEPDIQSLDIQMVENGFRVSCQPKDKPASGGGDGAVSPVYESPKHYVFSTVDDVLAFVTKKLKGLPTDEPESADEGDTGDAEADE